MMRETGKKTTGFLQFRTYPEDRQAMAGLAGRTGLTQTEVFRLALSLASEQLARRPDLFERLQEARWTKDAKERVRRQREWVARENGVGVGL